MAVDIPVAPERPGVGVNNLLIRMAITAVRNNLPGLVRQLSKRPAVIVELDRHNRPEAYLVNYETFHPLIDAYINGDLTGVLTALVISRWLEEGAPPHLVEPQRTELQALTAKQLIALHEADPCCDDDSALESAGIDARIVGRLRRRRQLALAIAEAEAHDLYEVSEHLADHAG